MTHLQGQLQVMPVSHVHNDPWLSRSGPMPHTVHLNSWGSMDVQQGHHSWLHTSKAYLMQTAMPRIKSYESGLVQSLRTDC